jgi:hypothetical protein
MRRSAWVIGALLLGWALGSVVPTFADTIPIGDRPGSTADPLVTKSYVDERIRQMLDGKTPVQEDPSKPAVEETAPKVLRLKAGEEVIGKSGTQLIVRAGKAVIRSDGANGLADVTDGVDLQAGVVAPKNLLIVPRDGRGVAVEAGFLQDVYVTVNGPHEVRTVAEGQPPAGS